MKEKNSDLLNAAAAAEESGNYAVAFECWQRLASIGNRPDYLIKFGRVAQKLGRWADAERAFLDVLEINKEFSLAMTLLGSLFLARTDGEPSANARQAKNWLEQAVVLDQNPVSLSLLGAAQNQLGDKEAAIEAFRRAIELDKLYEEAYFNLGLLLAERGDKREAESLLRKATQLDPSSHEAHGRLGVLLQELGKYSEGEAELRRALEIDPTDATASFYLHREGNTPDGNN